MRVGRTRRGEEGPDRHHARGLGRDPGRAQEPVLSYCVAFRLWKEAENYRVLLAHSPGNYTRPARSVFCWRPALCSHSAVGWERP